MKIIFFGTPQAVIPILEKLKQEFDLVGIVTTPDQKLGRKQILTPTPVARWAKEQRIEVIKTEKLDQQFIDNNYSKLDVDLFVVASFGQLISQSVLEMPKLGSLNVHPSKLPKYRGASPIQSAILTGDKETALTIIKMDQLMDHGPIIYQQDYPLNGIETTQDLMMAMFKLAAEVLPQVIWLYSQGKIEPIGQDHSRATFCDHIKKQDGYFELNNLPKKEKLDRMIRAYYPWPTVWTKWRGKVVKFLPSFARHFGLDPESKKMDSRLRGNDDGDLIQMEGKKPVSLKEFLNGYPDFPVKEL